MNPLRSRKLVYLAGILVLAVPIIYLGMPAGAGFSGKLANLRRSQGLAETSFGQVDPSSATMNLLLLGLRGPAVTSLFLQLDQQKNTKNWAQMRATTNAIITLEPHFKQVWSFHGWNLAYNVSAEWDAVPDRYYWVKEGAKFTVEGSERNQIYPELSFDAGKILSQKIGRSDEWRFFREYFRKDPDPKFDGQPDKALNPNNMDNYLVAKGWFTRANEIDLEHPQRMMMSPMFRRSPAQAMMDYPDALEREGVFEEQTRVGWDDAFRELTQGYGQELYLTPGGNIRMEATPEEVIAMAKEQNIDANLMAHWQKRYRKMAGYLYWRTRSISEAETATMDAHREIYDGQTLFREGKLRPAREKLLSGMQKFEQVLERHPTLYDEDAPIEEGLMALLYWNYSYELLSETKPAEHPLKKLWTEKVSHRATVLDRFRRENRIQ